MEAYWILMGMLSLCGLSLCQKEYCKHTFVDFDIPGADVDIFISPNVEHCRKACTQNPTCTFYTYLRPDWHEDYRRLRCHLKDLSPGRPPFQPLVGATSGYSLKDCTCGLWDLCSNFIIKYHYVHQEKTWTEAQHYCRENFKDLATIVNEERMAEVVGVAGNSPNFWIGLHGSWEWCLDDKDFHGNGETDFRYWFDSEPDVVEEQACALIHITSKWRDASCTETHWVLCYSKDSNQHILVDTPMSWFDGQKYCRERYTDLASIRNKEENAIASRLFDPNGTLYAWIGLQRNWAWSDQKSNLPFRKWGHRQPGGDEIPGPGDRHEKKPCASVRWNKEWKSTDCTEKLPFVCYEVLDVMKRVVKMELSPEGSVDLNDPAAREAILEQIKKKMAEQGLHEDLEISWKIQPDGKIFHKKIKENVTLTPNVCEDIELRIEK